MFIVTRRYRLAKEESLQEVVRKTEREGVPEFRKLPGFIDYYYMHSKGSVMAISLYENRESAEESSRIAGEWVRKNIPGLYEGSPEVIMGEVLIHARQKERRGEAA